MQAVSAARTCGVLPDNTHFLDMPFYQTGMAATQRGKGRVG